MKESYNAYKLYYITVSNASLLGGLDLDSEMSTYIYISAVLSALSRWLYHLVPEL